jgi:dTDP-glucose 4,6-dehydratase
MDSKISFLHLPTQDINHVLDAVSHRWQRLRGQRLLLTGGTGFIGKWLLESFLEANRRFSLNAQVVVLSRSSGSFLKKFPNLLRAQDVIWINDDVRNLSIDSVGECSFAIHAATDVVASITHKEILDTCIEGTRRVLEAMSTGKNSRRMLLLSSGAVYGKPPPEIQTIPEDWYGAPDPLSPSSAYGEGKRISELMAAMALAVTPGLEIAIARCFAFVGPYLPLDKHFAIGNFIGSAMRNEDIYIQGDGTPLRSYLYASDLTIWLWTMLFDAPNGRAYNLGGDESVSICQLANRVNQVLNGCGKVFLLKAPQPGCPPQVYVPSLARISTELRLTPSISLDEAICRTARWVSEGHYE